MGDDHEGHDSASGHDAVAAPDPGPLDLERKVDIIAGAVAELEGRVAQMAGELTSLGPKLNELLDRHPAGLGAASEMTAAVAADVATTALEPVHTGLAALDATTAATRDEVLRSREAIDRLASTLARLEDTSDDRLAAVRDAAMAPVSDLQAMLAARGERLDRRLEELVGAVQALRDDASAEGPAEGTREDWTGAPDDWVEGDASAAPIAGRPEEWDGAGAPATPPALASDEVVEQITGRMETALAGLLRLIDERLASVRMAVSAAAPGAGPPPQGNVGGFEAGAVMGAAQAAWNRLEQRLDTEFDDLSRQLQAMAAMIEQASASAEAAATRPVVTGEQLRHAASTVKDSVLKVSRARRERRGGPRGLNPGS